MRYAIAMFTAAAAVFIAIGANSVLEQQRILEAARPVSGEVTSSEVREFRTTDPKTRRIVTTVRPVVRYHYSYGNSIFGDNRVFPVSDDTSRRRAQQIVDRFPPGKKVTVWINPLDINNPAGSARRVPAFLIREWDFSPYLIVLCAMVFLSTGLGFWAAAPWRQRQLFPPKSASGGWHELNIRTTIVARRRPYRAASLVWFVIGSVTAGHYFLHADRPYDLTALIAVPLYFALGLVPISFYIRELRRARTFRDVRLTVNTDTFWIGKPFNIKLEQIYRRPATIELARIGLVCDKFDQRTRKNKRVATRTEQFETWEEFRTGESVSPGHPLQTKARFTAPANQPPTTPENHTGYPRFAWRIIVEVKTTPNRTYRAEFPIIVES